MFYGDLAASFVSFTRDKKFSKAFQQNAPRDRKNHCRGVSIRWRRPRVYKSEPDLYDKVVERFSKFTNVNVVKGIVLDSFEKACPKNISL